MKIAVQLLKEFWIPFLGALAWVAFNYSGDIKQSTTLFGGTFFFIAWLTGQIFRVKKQNATESSMLAIREDIKELLFELKAETKKLIGHLTGGDSYCCLSPTGPIENGSVQLWLDNHGTEYPMYDVSARVVDLEAFSEAVRRPDFNLGSAAALMPSVGFVPASHAIPTPLGINLGNADRRSFNIFIVARNGAYEQFLRYVKVNDNWRRAIQIKRKGADEHIYEFVETEFPTNADGTVTWH